MIPEKSVFPTISKSRTGVAIRAYMDMRGLTAEDVRKALNLGSVQSVYHWLEGISIPSVDNLYALSVLLDVPIDHLLRGNYDYVWALSVLAQKQRMEYYKEQLKAA